MSTFDIKAFDLLIEPHPREEVTKLELCKIGGFVTLVPKGKYKTGDRAVYIPTDSLVPEKIIDALGIRKLDQDGNPLPIEKGKALTQGGDRVKPVKFVQQLSQGLVHRPDFTLDLETDYADVLGITKYVHKIPAHLAGSTYHVYGITPYSDIERIEKYPDTLQDGELVVMSEKLHGTCLIAYFDGENVHVSSRGMAKKLLALEDTKNQYDQSTNFYHRALMDVDGYNKLAAISKAFGGQAVTLYGEGLPAQDLKYGLDPHQPTVRAFDLKIGHDYADYETFTRVMAEHDIPVAPPLHVGPFSYKILAEHTSGKTTLNDKHIREGVVVKPVIERSEPDLGRVILKSISEKYLMRKEGTEWN